MCLLITFFCQCLEVSVVYVAPLAEPSLWGVAVKLLPCISLFVYVWLTQISSLSIDSSQSTLRQLQELLGLTNSTERQRNDREKSKKDLGRKPIGSPDVNREYLRRSLRVRMTRGLIMAAIGDIFLVM